MSKKSKSSLPAWRLAFLLLLGWLLYSAGREFHEIAWGTGDWYGKFSLKWLAALVLYVLLALSSFWLAADALFRPEQLKNAAKRVIAFRESFGNLRWLVAASMLFAPLILLQYSNWGIVISGLHLRILIWGSVVALLAVISTRGSKTLTTWPIFLGVLIVSAAIVSLGAALTNVTDYPFSLGWSEGNRLYDYSLLFGADRYSYSGQAPRPFLDIGRELLGGLPFILSGLTILGARLWLAVLAVFPYLLFGWFAFVLPNQKKELGLSAMGALWAFLFVKQGPIHPPLLLCAILVALAWRRTLWIAFLLVFAAGYFAQISRGTWMFAPAMWVAMLEFSSGTLKSKTVGKEVWVRTIALSVAGLFGGVLLPMLQRLISSSANIVSIPSTDQPLLWYRLLPNATYGTGILVGLLLAAGPLVALLIYLIATRRWKLILLQRLLLAASLLAFLVVGLVVSTKIGGGGDLHNLDMFIIGLAFTAAVAWRNGGSRWLSKLQETPAWARAALTLMITIAAIQPLMRLRPLASENQAWLMTLAGIENPRSLRLLPRTQTIEDSLETIRTEVDLARTRGEVLFMDQRQLLTFGYITNVPLIAEYEKKLLMNEALSGDAAFFEPFYEDLKNARFEMIVTEPLFTPIKDEEYAFGEENNAWVTWVSKPVLCYYEPIEWLVEIRVQLLVPRADDPDCSTSLPIE